MASKRTLILPDTQIPFDDRKALKKVVEFVGAYQPDEIVHIGDLMDYPSPSRWTKDTRGEFEGSVYQDSETAKKRFLEPLRAVYDGPVGVHEGNHDERPRVYLDKYAPALSGTDAFNVETLLDFDGFGVELLPEFYEIAPGWISTHGHRGGIRLNQIAGNTALNAAKKFGKSVIMGHCFDDQTEILTPEGWVSHDKLTTNSFVLTADRETKALEWQKVQEVHRYDDYEELIHVQAMGVDLMVTPEHGLVTERRADGSWNFPSAEEVFGKEVTLPLASEHDDEILPLFDDEIRFIALVMADGSVDERGHIRISQSDDGKGDFEETERILTSLGYDYSKVLRYEGGKETHGTYRNYDAYRFGVKSQEARDLIAKYLDGPSKNPNRNLAGMSVHQMNVFLDMYTLTDGCWHSESVNSRQLMSKDKEKLDFIQELAVRTGHRSSMGDHHITVNSRSSVRVRSGNWSKESYSGTVWCVSVPNGTLVVRRNGKTAITQNTHRLGMLSFTRGYNGKADETLNGVEVGNLMDMRQASYLKGGTANWQQGFVILHQDGRVVRPELIPITGRAFIVDGHTWKI